MTSSNDTYKTPSDDEMSTVNDAVEETLDAADDAVDHKYSDMKDKAGQTLHDMKKRLSHTTDRCCRHTRHVASCADEYVRENPWAGVGMGAVAGMIVALLLVRR